MKKRLNKILSAIAAFIMCFSLVFSAVSCELIDLSGLGRGRVVFEDPAETTDPDKDKDEGGSGSTTDPEGGSGSTTDPEGGSGSTTDPEGGSGSTTDPEGGSGSTTDPEGGSGSTTDPIADPDEPHVKGVFPDNLAFYPYFSAFKAAQTSKALTLKSRKELKAYISYVNFYEIKEHVQLTLTYAPAFKDEFQAANDEYNAEPHFMLNCQYGISYLGNGGSYYITSGGSEILATKTLDPEKEHVDPQVDYALKMTAPETRAEDFDDFGINSFKSIPNVYNSEQLRWTVQNGYKPECVAGSPAERMYNKAKATLRKIVDDDMSDVVKLRAIYEWLVFNVQYDNFAADNSGSIENANEYDSWYLEGVFDKGKAVCEGYAKALILMACIEDIPAVFVTGNMHAWNKVKVNGVWYVVDATHADVHTSGKERFSYSSFMTTDAEKAYRGYPTTDYQDCVANTYYNVYEHIKFTRLLSTEDLVADSSAELVKIVDHAREKAGAIGENGCTVDVFIKKENSGKINLWLSSVGGKCSATSQSKDKDGNVYLALYLS